MFLIQIQFLDQNVFLIQIQFLDQNGFLHQTLKMFLIRILNQNEFLHEIDFWIKLNFWIILTKTAIAFWRLCVEFEEVGNSNFAVEHLEFDFQAVLILEMSSTDVVAVEEFINSSLFSKSFFCLKNFNFCQNFGNLNFGAKIWTLQIGEIQNPTF